MIKGLTLIAQGGFALGIFTAEQQQIISWIIDDILSISITFAIVNLAIFFPAVFRGLHRKIAANRAKSELDALLTFSIHVVNAAEVSINGRNPQLKYDFACHALDAYCKHSGAPVPSEDLKRILIESAVYSLRENTGWHYLNPNSVSERKTGNAPTSIDQ